MVGVGVGGREQDYRSLDVPFEGRHRRSTPGVAELRRLWIGRARLRRVASPWAPPRTRRAGPHCGPRPWVRGPWPGPPRGPTGSRGFSIGADPDEIARVQPDGPRRLGGRRAGRPPPTGQRHLLPPGRGRRRRRTQAVRPRLPRRLRRQGRRRPVAAGRVSARPPGCSTRWPRPRPPAATSSSWCRGRSTRTAWGAPRHWAPDPTDRRLEGPAPDRIRRSDGEVLALPDARLATDGSRPVSGPGRCTSSLERVDLALQGTQGHPDQVGEQRVLEVEWAPIALRGRLRAMTCPGTPTTTESGGTSRTTTALAPIRLLLPTVTGPSTLAPAPMVDPVPHGRVALAGLECRCPPGSPPGRWSRRSRSPPSRRSPRRWRGR